MALFKFVICSSRPGLSNALRFMVIRLVEVELKTGIKKIVEKFTLVDFLTCASLFEKISAPFHILAFCVSGWLVMVRDDLDDKSG